MWTGRDDVACDSHIRAGLQDDDRQGHPPPAAPRPLPGGKIESGIVRIGDRLNLVDGAVVREVTCDAVEFVDVDVHRPELVLIAVLGKSLVPGDASEGQTLASVPAGE